MTSDTLQRYDAILSTCRAILLAKHQDYGSSWRVLRSTALTDQLYIKAYRIRQVSESGVQAVDDPLDEEYVGLINYSLMAIIQLQHPEADGLDVSASELAAWYDQEVQRTRDLLAAKNQDYGEIWRKMRVSTYINLILAKLLRIKQIEDNAGETTISEGIASNYRDIINYSFFALVRRAEDSLTQHHDTI